jgi:hypothetical protein
MKYKSIIQNVAKQDLREAAKWYDTKRKGLGKEFLDKIKENIDRLKSNPFIAQIRYFEVHTAVVDVYPFMIHYYIDPDKKLL